MRDEIKAQARRPVDEANAAKTRANAQARSGLQGAGREVAAHLKGGRGGR